MEQELKRLRTDHQTMKANIDICARILGEIHDNVLGELKLHVSNFTFFSLNLQILQDSALFLQKFPVNFHFFFGSL